MQDAFGKARWQKAFDLSRSRMVSSLRCLPSGILRVTALHKLGDISLEENEFTRQESVVLSPNFAEIESTS